MKSLKLDFNERADSIPKWLNDFNIDTSELWKYPDRKVIETKIAKQFNLNEDQVFISNGGDESIELLFKLCKLKNKSILLPLPAFSQYTHNIKVWGIDYETLNSKKDLSIDTKAILDHLNPNQWLILTRPNNPTGECIAEQKLVQILDRAKETGTQVFLDEAYIEFFQNFENRLYAKEYENVICLRSFSKAYGLAGARVGYLLGNSQLINKFKSIAMPFNVNRLSLQLVNQALDNKTEVIKYCQKIDSNRLKIIQLLKDYQVDVFLGEGNFLLFRLNQKLKTMTCNYLRRIGIQIKTQMQGLEDCVRLTIPENIDNLWTALTKIFNPEILGFDMDGVLIDTSKSYDVCIQKTVESFTSLQPELSEIISLREQGGFNNDWDLALALIQKNTKNILFNDVKKVFQELYLGTESTQGLVNNEDLLLDSNMWNKNNTRKAIITGRPKAEAINGIEKLNIQINMLVSADDVVQQKPSPEGLLKVQQQLKSNNMWFFGDTVDDIQAGTKANCLCIGIGQNSHNLYLAGADLVLEDINQFKQLLPEFRAKL